MATKADLEAREAECSSVEDYVKLAREALADPADPEYAKELLQKAEAECQMPMDYMAVGDVAVEMGDTDYARELYDQAEDMLFDAQEYMAFAKSMGKLGDQDKAREYLEKAAAEVTQPEDLLTLARIAAEDLKDEELAQSLVAKVEEKAKSLEDFAALARKVKEAGDESTARMLLDKAARFVDGIPQTVEYAKLYVELFDDKDKAREILEEAETDCQFTKQFVELAAGFKALLGDQSKVDELMEQAAEFCMTGEEYADLADGYWRLQGDKDKAVEAYRQALGDITDKEQLLALARKVATELENPELAKEIYAKAEQKMSSAKELANLARSVLEDLKDKAHAAGIYESAAGKLANPGDLINLASDVFKSLGDTALAGKIYEQAFEKASDFKQLLKLVDQSFDELKDSDFAKRILEKAESLAEASPDLLRIAEKALEKVDAKDFARRVLEAAEESVTSLGELRSVTEAVKKHFADDEGWIGRIQEKLEKREANQEKYAALQERENRAKTVLDYLALVDDVMAELQDAYYARKLLTSAEQMYNEQGGDFAYGRLIALSIDKHLGDADWVKRLLDEAAGRCRTFTCVHDVAHTAALELRNKEAGAALARGYYADWEQKLDAADIKGAFDYVKLARAVLEDLGDPAWALKLVDKAEALGGDTYAFEAMASVALKAGDRDKAHALLRKAADACGKPEDLEQLALRMQADGIDGDFVREVYASGRERFTDPEQQLRWVEGIMEVFRDEAWAAKEYDALADRFASGPLAKRYRVSRQSRLHEGLWYRTRKAGA